MSEGLTLRRYVAGDVQLIPARPDFASMAGVLDPGLLAGGVPPGKAWTADHHGFPLGCGGVFEIWNGRWAAWTWIGPVPFRARRFVARACMGGIEHAVRAGARRIEATCRADVDWASAFLERLGFAREGLARRWGPDGADHLTFALIPEDRHGR